MKDIRRFKDCVQLKYTRRYLDGSDSSLMEGIENQDFHFALSRMEQLARTKLSCGLTIDDVYGASWDHVLDTDEMHIVVQLEVADGGQEETLRYGSPDYLNFITYVAMCLTYVAELEALQKGEEGIEVASSGDVAANTLEHKVD